MSTEIIIQALSDDLRPVRRLPRPGLRAAAWLGAVGGLGLVLLPMAQLDEVRRRLVSVPDLAWACGGAGLTAVCAAWAAFQVSVPGRSLWWMALPLPPALLWVSASGWGCLRPQAMPDLAPADLHDTIECVTFILLVSTPLSALLLWMLHRARPLWPGRVAGMAGLAAAAAAATLLTLFHQHDGSAIDLVVHAVAVSAVILGCRVAGR